MLVMRFHRIVPVCWFVVGSAWLAATGVGGPWTVAPVHAQAPAQDTAKGASLLAEARKALGGEDKLAAVKRLEVKGESRRAQGNQSIEGDLEILIELPDKYKRKEALMLGGNAGLVIERVEALNGSDSWESTDGGNFPGRGGFGGGGRGGDGGRGGNGGGGGDFRGGGGRGGAIGELLGGAAGQAPGQPGIDPERLREAQRRTRQADFSRLLLGMLLVSNGSVAWIGTAQSPDGTADVLEITPPEGQPMRLLLDTATHMPLMMTWQGAAPRAGGGGGRRGGGAGRGDGTGRGGDPAAGAQPAAPAGETPAPPDQAPAAGQAQARRGGAGTPQATLEMHLTEYKVVNGIKLPHLITRGSGGQTTEEFEIKSYKINPNFKANTFIQDK
jgi:hypothetical protein